jgi:hypothetical protein
MILDGNLIFDGPIPQNNSGIAGTNVFSNNGNVPSTNVLDQLNAHDMGAGSQDRAMLQVFVLVTASFAGGTSLNVQVQGSTDSVTYTTYTETGAVPIAALAVGAKLGLRLPSVNPDQGPLPRYYRLNYVCAGSMVAGAVITGLGAIDGNRSYAPGVVVRN